MHAPVLVPALVLVFIVLVSSSISEYKLMVFCWLNTDAVIKPIKLIISVFLGKYIIII